jgi:hypothetical protein
MTHTKARLNLAKGPFPLEQHERQPPWLPKMRAPILPLTSCLQWTPPPAPARRKPLPMCKVSLDRLWLGPFSPGEAHLDNRLEEDQKLGEVRSSLAAGDPWQALEVAISVKHPDLCMAALGMVEAHPRMTGVALDLYDSGLFLAAEQVARAKLPHRQHSLTFQMMLTYYKREAHEMGRLFMKAWEHLYSTEGFMPAEVTLRVALDPWYLNQPFAAPYSLPLRDHLTMVMVLQELQSKRWWGAEPGADLFAKFTFLGPEGDRRGSVVGNPPTVADTLAAEGRGLRPLFLLRISDPGHHIPSSFYRNLTSFGLEVHGRMGGGVHVSLPSSRAHPWFERRTLQTFLKDKPESEIRRWNVPGHLHHAALQYEEILPGMVVARPPYFTQRFVLDKRDGEILLEDRGHAGPAQHLQDFLEQPLYRASLSGGRS